MAMAAPLALLPPEVQHRLVLPLLRPRDLLALALSCPGAARLVTAFLANHCSSLDFVWEAALPCTQLEVQVMAEQFGLPATERATFGQADQLQLATHGSSNLRRVSLKLQLEQRSIEYYEDITRVQGILLRLLTANPKLERLHLESQVLSTGEGHCPCPARPDRSVEPAGLAVAAAQAGRLGLAEHLLL
jgi:hypothetical protein